MPTTRCLFSYVLMGCVANSTLAAEPIVAEPLAAAPATRSAAAVDARQFALQQYFYVDFPRQVQALENEIELAEAEYDLIARRVASYRPFRSFGTYAATYMADQSWQVELLDAQHRLQCLRNSLTDLWRQRQLVAQAYVATMQ